MTAARMISEPKDTLPVLNQGLRALEKRLTASEKEDAVVKDFYYVLDRLTAASQAYAATQPIYLGQAAVTSGKYFEKNGALKLTGSVSQAALEVLNAYAEYAEAWANIEMSKRPALAPNYEGRARSIREYLQNVNFAPRAEASAASAVESKESKQEKRVSL